MLLIRSWVFKLIVPIDLFSIGIYNISLTDGTNIIIFLEAQSTKSIQLKYTDRVKIQLKQHIQYSQVPIDWWLCFLQSVPEELQNGEGFGYIIMFRPLGSTSWTKAVVNSVEASKYIYRNESITPLFPFEVKVGVFNNEGVGTLSSVYIVYSGEEGKQNNSFLAVYNIGGSSYSIN